MTTQGITSVSFEDFTLFDEITIPFSKNINIISGETGSGKTNVIKALYCLGKTINNVQESLDPISNERIEEMLASKLMGVFRPDNRKVGRLVKRKTGRGTASCKITFSDDTYTKYSFSNLATKSVDLVGFSKRKEKPNFIYIPAKEIISATENFAAVYEKYHIAFEETYYDLNKLLLLPTKKGPLNANQKKLVKTLEKIMQGKVTSHNQKFFLNTTGIGKIEMGLLAEGFRKIATLLQLISNEVLTENTVLFWDEPESNINPRMIPALKDLLIQLSKMGVQIFVTTHSFFLQQEISLHSQYKDLDLDVSFINLYKSDGVVKYEKARNVTDLDHNPIQKEFDELFNREQELFYDNDNSRRE